MPACGSRGVRLDRDAECMRCFETEGGLSKGAFRFGGAFSLTLLSPAGRGAEKFGQKDGETLLPRFSCTSKRLVVQDQFHVTTPLQQRQFVTTLRMFPRTMQV